MLSLIFSHAVISINVFVWNWRRILEDLHGILEDPPFSWPRSMLEKTYYKPAPHQYPSWLFQPVCFSPFISPFTRSERGPGKELLGAFSSSWYPPPAVFVIQRSSMISTVCVPIPRKPFKVKCVLIRPSIASCFSHLQVLGPPYTAPASFCSHRAFFLGENPEVALPRTSSSRLSPYLIKRPLVFHAYLQRTSMVGGGWGVSLGSDIVVSRPTRLNWRGRAGPEFSGLFARTNLGFLFFLFFSCSLVYRKKVVVHFSGVRPTWPDRNLTWGGLTCLDLMGAHACWRAVEG